MSRVVVTGGTGFLGTAFCLRAIEKNFSVINLRPENRKSNTVYKSENYSDYYFGELEELASLEVWSDVSAVIHMATDYGRGDENDTRRCNVEFPLEILKQSIAAKVPLFINVDTFFSDLPWSYPYLKSYRETKREFREHAITDCVNQAELRFVNARVFHMYGPNDGAEKFVSRTLQLLAENQPIELTSGHQTRDFVYVEDVAAALLTLANSRDKLTEVISMFDVATGKRNSIRDFVSTAKAVVGSTSSLLFGALADREGEALLENFEANLSSWAGIGWEPKVSLEQGLKKIYAMELG